MIIEPIAEPEKCYRLEYKTIKIYYNSVLVFSKNNEGCICPVSKSITINRN